MRHTNQGYASPTSSQSNIYSSNSSFRSTSPLPPPATTQNCMSGPTKSYKYLRKLLKFDQMDFEFALWQMVYLFVSPQKLYRNFSYRKQTKSQFARDDPAFLVLLILCVCISSTAFTYTLDLSFSHTIYCIFYIVIVDFILVGIVVATASWLFTNRYLRQRVTDGDVEWGYCFDVHLNAFFPPLILLHFIQLLFFNTLINHDYFTSMFLGNTFWLIAIGYYIYITFLGYNCISFLRSTRVFLAPAPVLFLFYVVSLIIRWNITIAFVDFFHYRVM